MFGTFGYELDLTKLTNEKKSLSVLMNTGICMQGKWNDFTSQLLHFIAVKQEDH